MELMYQLQTIDNHCWIVLASSERSFDKLNTFFDSWHHVLSVTNINTVSLLVTFGIRINEISLAVLKDCKSLTEKSFIVRFQDTVSRIPDALLIQCKLHQLLECAVVRIDVSISRSSRHRLLRKH